jgi:hypothetical protein
MKNIPIVIGFGIITVSQLAFGIFWTILVARGGGKISFFKYASRLHPNTNPLRCDRAHVAGTYPQIPFDAYRICVFLRHRTLEIAYTSISLVYGTFGFLCFYYK